MKTFILILFFFIFTFVAFLAGGRFANKNVGASVDEMQAELSFGHLIDYAKIKTDLADGCDLRAKARVDYYIDQQMMLMAEYVQNTESTDTNLSHFDQYVTFRDQALMQTLKNYKVDWKKVWEEPVCIEAKNTKEIRQKLNGKRDGSIK